MGLSKQQHEGFAIFFEKPTREGLRDLIKNNIGETDYLDFKAEWIEFPKLAKHILAFSNSGGGAIVIGIKQNDDGTLDSIGVNDIIDKEIITKGINAYLPDDVTYDVFDFSYKESEYPDIKGKKYQVLLVEYDPRHIPLLSKKAGDGIKDNVVYVRRGTNSDEATHEELQKVINARLETGFSSKHILDLSEHLEQLRVLYRSSGGRQFTATAQFIEMLEGDKMKDYRQFIKVLIDRKKKVIEEKIKIVEEGS